MKNRRLLDALRCENRGRPPIWLMRQAGRYLPEYQEIRRKHRLIDMFHEPEIAAEVTLLPLKKFELDAAIIFSDILMVPDALGIGLHFKEGVGPIIERPLHGASDIDALEGKDVVEHLHFVKRVIEMVKPNVEVPLLGFCGAPFTVASYMIEGGSSRDFKKTKQWMIRDPESFHRLLDILTRNTIDYLKMQIEAGVDAIQIFDSWANVLDHPHFLTFSLAYIKKIVDAMPDIPIILFCRGSSVFAKELASIHPAAISLDWNVDITHVRPIVSKTIALQGNLDPDMLYAPSQILAKATRKIVEGMRNDPGYIFNLGHGIKPDTPVDAVKTLLEVIRS